MTLLSQLVSKVNTAQSTTNNANNPLSEDQSSLYKSEGFSLPPSFTADGNGLPYTKVQPNQEGKFKRNIITWFVPEFGIVTMYVNPSEIRYSETKAIVPERTKGGYTLQYWGEELGSLSIRGTTGSSGIEGINMLREIYRAEQLAFDSTGLNIAANNASADISNNLINGAASMFTSDPQNQAIGSGLLGGLVGLNSPNNSIATKNIPSLAQLAFTVEMYYDGEVFRGFFKNFEVTESATDFAFQYSTTFTVTQRRGYRTNYFPFHKSPVYGASQDNTPNSFSGKIG